MAYEITNIYQELELSTSVTKTEDILSAIDAQIKKWQSRVNNPKFKLEAPAHTAALKKIRTEIQANPAIITQYAVAYAQIEKQRHIMKASKLLKIIQNELKDYPIDYLKNKVVDDRYKDPLVKQLAKYSIVFGYSLKRKI